MAIEARQPKDGVVRLAYGREPFQYGDLRIPDGDGPFPLVILIHGGFWRQPFTLLLMDGLADDLLQHGIASWNIEYRRVGHGTGGWPTTLVDVARAGAFIQYLPQFETLDLSRIIAIGHSAGGQLAAWLAGFGTLIRRGKLVGLFDDADIVAATPIYGIVCQAGVLDLVEGWRKQLGKDAVGEFLGGAPMNEPKRYAVTSPVLQLPLGVRQALVHGTADDRVPVTMSIEYASQASSVGEQVELFVLPDVDHFALIDPTSDAWKVCRNVVQRWLSAEA
ncbi:MAG: hypothetical protein NVSMB42_23320 [Herpetosiphon sp.]